MNNVRDALVGKTITGVISRPGKDGLPELLVLALEDGSYMQFVVPDRRRRKFRSHSRRDGEEFPTNGVMEEVSEVQSTPPGLEQLPLIHTACG